jgi:hypothetical protein
MVVVWLVVHIGPVHGVAMQAPFTHWVPLGHITAHGVTQVFTPPDWQRFKMISNPVATQRCPAGQSQSDAHQSGTGAPPAVPLPPPTLPPAALPPADTAPPATPPPAAPPPTPASDISTPTGRSDPDFTSTEPPHWHAAAQRTTPKRDRARIGEGITPDPSARRKAPTVSSR